jgi:hypothetical protein
MKVRGFFYKCRNGSFVAAQWVCLINKSNDYSTVPEWQLHAAEGILGFDKS